MDFFALQEELDSVRVQRTRRRDDRPPVANPRGKSSGVSGDADNSNGNLEERQPCAGDRGELVSSSDVNAVAHQSSTALMSGSFGVSQSSTSLVSGVVQDVHPLSAEYALRAKYVLHMQTIIGKGAYGEVFVGTLRDHPPPLGPGSSSVHGGMGGTGGSGGTTTCASPSQLLRRSNSFSSDRSQQQFAIKRIDKRNINPKSLSLLFGEVETLSLLSHGNIVKLQDTFQDDNYLWIVMEYVKGGELAKVLKRVGRLTENVARKVAMSLLFGIEYIHEKGIVHRDLKPANCLLTKLPAFMKEQDQPSNPAASLGDVGVRGVTAEPQTVAPSPSMSSTATIGQLDSTSSRANITVVGPSSPSGVASSSSSSWKAAVVRRNRPEDFVEEDFGNLKIADFGFAVMVGRAECLTNFCGTQHYMAPEVIRRDGLNYGKAVDIWSFGVILYLILSGEYPFTSTEQICHGRVQFLNTEANDHVWARVSPQAKDFILRLLVVDPTKRPSATEALRHPWIKSEYSQDSDEVSSLDYPITKGIWRAHSKWLKSRNAKHRFPGVAHAVIFAHRLVFLARLQAMRREGIADISMLRHFPYIVHGFFEPTNHIAASGRRFLGNIAALRRLADMVGSSQTVEVFDVSSSSIDDLSLVQHIVKVAYTHPSLICLNLENNPIPPLAGRALIRLARSLTHKLNVINVNNTNLGYDTISQVDMCLKETIRKRSEAALAAAVVSGTGCSVSSQISALSSMSSHHSNFPRDAQSPLHGTRARTVSPHVGVVPMDDRLYSNHPQQQQSIFHSNSVSPTTGVMSPTSASVRSSSELMSSPTRRLATPSRVGPGSPSLRVSQQQQRRSQLPPLVELDIRARGAASNAVRQIRSSGLSQ